MVNRINAQFPTEQPQETPYGILSPAVTVVTEEGNEWLAGFPYTTADAATSVTIEPIIGGEITDGYKAVEADPSKPVVRHYLPFSVKAYVKASTLGTNVDELQEMADRALDVVMQKSIETEFWNGTLAKKLTDPSSGRKRELDNRYLSADAAVDVTPTAGTPVKVRYGQALLEQALGSGTIGSTGVIHAPLLIASALEVDDIDGALTTNLGTKVVAGAGYSNTGPRGEVAPTNSAWMYATGPVTVRIGVNNQSISEKLSEAIVTGKNTVEFYVDRPAAVTWSTSTLYAVLVDLTLDYA